MILGFNDFVNPACKQSLKQRAIWIPKGSSVSGVGFRGNIRVQEERAEQALLAYRQTILMALAEVASATLAYNQEQIRLEALQGAVEGLHYRNAPTTTSQQNRSMIFVGAFNYFPRIDLHIGQSDNIFRKLNAHICTS
jgi:hypothetical protein